MNNEALRPATLRRVDAPREAKILFSICTLVTDEALYREMSESFRRGGFDGEDVEFLYIDNVSGNRFDAYAGLNCLISHASGRYLILCHQDVSLIEDGRDVLLARLRELDAVDPGWALAGNAGGLSNLHAVGHYTNRDGLENRYGKLPEPAVSLDENFIVMKSASRLAFSRDLNGFHFYGTDICLQAASRGWNAYVIDFHLRHDGQGAMGESFYQLRTDLEEKYGRLLRPRILRTTCTTLFLDPSRRQRALRRCLEFMRWYRRSVWKWLRGKPIPPRI